MRKRYFGCFLAISIFLISFLVTLNSLEIKNHALNDQSDQIIEIIDEKFGKNDVYEFPTAGATYQTGIYVEGNYAFLSCYGSSANDLAIIDITNPTSPGPGCYIQLNVSAQDVYVDGNYAYVANTGNGMSVVDITDPTQPIFITNLTGSDPAYAVQVAGNFAYLACYGLGLGVVEISDPANLPLLTTTGTAGNARDVFIQGDYAYVANSNAGLAVLDISNPAVPVLVANAPISGGTAVSIFVSGDFCYMAVDGSSEQLAVFNVTDPTNPSTPIYQELGSSNGPKRIDIVGDLCYITQSFSGLAIVNISNPMDPGEPIYQKMYQNRAAMDVKISGEYAYIAIEDWGLNVVKIGELIEPEIPYYGAALDSVMGLFIDGDYAYLADDFGGGLSVMDISDPTRPLLIDSCSTLRYARDVFVSGNWAYVANWDATSPLISFINITDPKNLGPCYDFTPNNSTFDVVVAGNFAFFASGEGLLVVNVTTPPTATDSILVEKSGMGLAYGVDVSGNFAYTAQTGGIVIFNITDPMNPQVVANYSLNQPAYAIDVEGDYAYLANNYDGLAIFNVSNPLSLSSPIYSNTSGRSVGIDIEGDRAYLADSSMGLAIIDISDSENPSAPVYRTFGSDTFDVYVEGDFAYLAIGTDGLAVVKIMDPWYVVNTSILQPISPNPNNDGIIQLNWTQVMNATIYYIYRENTAITTMTGLSPIAVTTNNYYEDHLTSNGQYHYAISAGNFRGRGWISNSEEVNVSITVLNQGYYGTTVFSANDTFVLTPQPLVANKWYGFYLDSTGNYDYNLILQRDGVDYHSSTMGPGEDDWILWYPTSSYNFSTVITFSSGDNTTYNYQFMNTTTRALGPGYFTRWFAGIGEVLQFNVPSTGNHYMKLYNSSGIRARLYGPAFPDDLRDASYVPKIELFSLDDSTIGTNTWLAASGLYTILINRIDNNTSYRNYTLEFCNDAWAPSSFGVVSPTQVINDVTPTVIGKFWETGSGVDISSVEYAYGTDGSLTPTNWNAVNGVYRDATCTIPAQDYDSGWLYVKVNAVPFNQYSMVNNTIRFRARDMVSIIGTQTIANIILIQDIINLNMGDYGNKTLTDGNDTYILNPWLLPANNWYGFYLGCTGNYDYDLILKRNGTDYISSSEGLGEDDWILWYPGPLYNSSHSTSFVADISYVSGDNTSYQYHFLDSSVISMGYNPESFTGKGQLLQVNFTTVGTYALRVWNAPDLRFRVFGPAISDASFNASNNPLAEIWNLPSTTSQNHSAFSITTPGTYVILVNRENNLTSLVNYDLYINLDSDPPAIYIIESPTDWINNQTPTVVCRFYEAVSGVNVSSVEFAFSTTGNITPTNWAAVDGVYNDLACTDPAEDWDSGWLYLKVNAVLFNDDSETDNIIRFRAQDMGGALGTSAAFIIKIDTRAPTYFDIAYPSDWVYNLTPSIVMVLNEVSDGLNISTVEYAYATDGNLTPKNWQPVDGVYADLGLTIPAFDGETGWVFVYMSAVPFNQDSGTLNTIRIRARDLAGNLGTQSIANITKIDSVPPSLFEIIAPTGWTNNQTPTVIGRFNVTSISGLDISSVEFAYAIDGTLPSIWFPVDGVFEDANCTQPASDGSQGWIYCKMNTVPFGQDSDVLNTIRLRASNLASLLANQTVATIIQIDTIMPSINVQNGSGQYYASVPNMDVDFTDVYSLDSAYYRVDSFTPTGTNTTGWVPIFENITVSSNGNNFVMDSNIWGNLTEGSHMVYFKVWDDAGNINDGSSPSWQFYKNVIGPTSFILTSLSEWVTDQTPMVVGAFYINNSGVNISSVQYAYSTTGDLNPTNWNPVTGVYNDTSYLHPAQNGDAGWLYILILAVPFNQDGNGTNTVCIRAADMLGNQGTQSPAYIVKIDSTPPSSFEVISPSDWTNNQTPTVIGRFYTELSGVNVSTVHFAYSTTGNSTPENWILVDGVYKDPACTDIAEDGDTGWLYAKINQVPFNQDSATLNTIRFSVTDIAGNTGVQGAAIPVKIDTQIPNWSSFKIDPTTPKPGDKLLIIIELNDSTLLSGFQSIVLFYSFDNLWYNINMTELQDEFTFTINIPSGATSVYAYLIIMDKAGNKQSIGSSESPLKIDVEKKKTDLTLIIILVVLAVVAVLVTGVVISRRRRIKTIEPVGKVSPTKKKISSEKGVALAEETLNVEKNIEYLLRNAISIENIPDLNNPELDQLIQRTIQHLSIEDIELLQSMELNELSDDEKMEILQDLMLLSKADKEAIISKLREKQEEPNSN